MGQTTLPAQLYIEFREAMNSLMAFAESTDASWHFLSASVRSTAGEDLLIGLALARQAAQYLMSAADPGAAFVVDHDLIPMLDLVTSSTLQLHLRGMKPSRYLVPPPMRLVMAVSATQDSLLRSGEVIDSPKPRAEMSLHSRF